MTKSDRCYFSFSEPTRSSYLLHDFALFGCSFLMEKETRKRKGASEGASVTGGLDDDVGRVRVPLTDSVVVITAVMINTELTCPICLGIIRNCTTVMECLHRFCLDCIEKSLRLGRKQCPSCRVACPSRRNLRQDANFDALVAKIYPDIKKAEATLQKMTLSMIKAQNHSAFAKAMEDGMFKQKEKSKRGYVDSSPLPMARPTVHSNNEAPTTVRRQEADTDESLPLSAISVQARPIIHVLLCRRTDCADVPELTKAKIRVTRLLTIDQLQRYLALKLESKPIVVYGRDGSDSGTTKTKDEILSPHLTLGAVDLTFWKNPAPMILYYASACVP